MPFSTLQENDCVGRQEYLTSLYKRVLLQAESGMVPSAVLSGPRGIGKTELLKQIFGWLFWKQDRVAPFYYTVNHALLSAAAFSKTYLAQFLCQRLAFEKKEQALLYRDGMSLQGLSALVEDREEPWAKEILDQYLQNAHDPVSSLRIALAAPHRSSLITGIPVSVFIDEFHLLQGISLEGASDPKMVSLFDEPLSFHKTPYLITGNTPEIDEMSVLSCLDRILIRPIGFADASSRIDALLRSYEVEGTVSPLLLRHLGGNPFYLGCIGRAVCTKKNPKDKDFWDSYLSEIMEGGLARYWSSVLKSYFPDLGLRRLALAVSHKIYHTSEPLSCHRLATTFTLTENQAEAIAHALYLAGFIRGEFGVFRAVEDSVLRDVIACLYLKEILSKPSHDVEREFLEKLLPEKTGVARFDLTLPMTKESELVAAQCLEQVGKNMNLNQDAIGQLQIAVIEACINAIEHSRGTERKMYVSVIVDEGRMEVSIESSGKEFIVQETGEPISGRETSKPSGRGWGIKLMKRFADDVRFEKTARGIKTVLIKHLDKSARVKKEAATNRE